MLVDCNRFTRLENGQDQDKNPDAFLIKFPYFFCGMELKRDQYYGGNRMMKFRLILLTCLTGLLIQSCAAPVLEQNTISRNTRERLQRSIQAIFADSIMTGTQYGVKVQSMKTGEIFFEHNSPMLFHPASNMKLLTTATALSRLGVDYRFKTVLAADSGAYSFSDTLIDGNLYLIGGGDPFLTLGEMVDMVELLKSSGIVHISGDLIGDESFMDSLSLGSGWMWDDEPATFIPHITALSLERNVTKVVVTPGRRAGDPVNFRFVPYSPEFTVSNSAITIDTLGLLRSLDELNSLDSLEAPGSLNDDPLDVDRDWMKHRNHFKISGKYSIDSGPDTTWLNVVNPGLFATSVFYDLVEQAGITWGGTYRLGTLIDSTETLVIHHSEPLSQIVYETNKVSDNLGAELVLKTMAAELTDTVGTAQNGLRIIRSFLQEIGVDSSSYRIVDGSGESHYNLINADLVIKLLNHMYHDFRFQAEFLASLPIGGIDGTLSGRMEEGPSFGNLRAKTGTVSGVSTLSGYVATADGEILAFSLMVQNFVGSSTPYRRLQDRFGDVLAGFSRNR